MSQESRLKKANKEWVESEGGLEHPTHIETLLRPEQQKRIKWLKEHCGDNHSVLDIGCNWGYILNIISGSTGIDINPENIKKAKEAFPDKDFIIGDVSSGLGIKTKSYDTVILADILEHIHWEKIKFVLEEASRVARQKILITLPWEKVEEFALCFKHKWLVDRKTLGWMLCYLMLWYKKVSVESDGTFVYIEVLL